MHKLKTEDVFGIRKNIKSYIERDIVVSKFTDALKSDKQVIVYGASKQGKTTLVSKYCDYDSHIVFHATPEAETADIYHSILRSAGIAIKRTYTTGTGRKSARTMKAKLTAAFAVFGKATGEIGSNYEKATSTSSEYDEIPFNLSLAQDVGHLFKKIDCKKIIIIENFHYLETHVQNQFAFDLRTFQDMGIRFIILGVWREKNKLLQFNGDLLERIAEIPVEPWSKDDFFRISKKGAKLLNINIHRAITLVCCEASFSSVGVFQSLLKSSCIKNGITHRQSKLKEISETNCIDESIEEKSEAYGSRHKQSLITIASGGSNNKLKLPYYIVRVIGTLKDENYYNGIPLDYVFDKVKRMHPNKKLKRKYVRNALISIEKLQSEKNINPPILAYDENANILHIIDSTMFFFLQNAKIRPFIDNLDDMLM